MAATKKDLWSAAIEAFEDGSHAVLERVCRGLLEHEPENFPVRMLLAHALLKMKRFPEAGDLLEGANPSDERTLVLWHRTTGDYYVERGDHEAAEDEYASALAIADAMSSDLVLDLVEARINQGSHEAALRTIETFVARHEHEPLDDRELLAFAKARVLRNLGRFDQALIAAREAEGLGRELGGFPGCEALIADLERRLDWDAKLPPETRADLDAE
ncbi:hypothetical protein DB30_02540 [Enhygromyxa salina]|uniref:Tetratricopeptide repeat protein n=1 Tax=Enhygromyxa salina TaxID=215803 RepID=A0A0C2CV76_9BACT|nr:tetratricopeptide repeat protein [Enhygromyxa salina]KIG11777.1 hypothetical protein DB30_02540 [Enhygromyxa salina]